MAAHLVAEISVGGADETVAVLEQWDSGSDTEKSSSLVALDRYANEIAAQPDPTDARLRVPTTPPVLESSLLEPERPDEMCVTLPQPTLSDGTNTTPATPAAVSVVSVREITETLRQLLPRASLKQNFTLYKRCCTGEQTVQALQTRYKCTPEQAVTFGTQLLSHTVLHPVGKKHKDDHGDFTNTAGQFYRLHCYHTPAVLNSYRVWTERIDPDAMALVKRLTKLLSTVEAAVTDTLTGAVNYAKAVELPDYAVFEEAVCELQQVNLFSMDEARRTAFGINVYNLMIKYAFMKVGIGTTNLARAAFFTRVQIMLAGHLFTFNDLENGILRGNRKPPYALSVPFNAKDPRLPLAVTQPDCRIHFALNCGAKSCPPVKFFTADALTDELRIVAMSFCEQEDHVRVDTATRTLHLSKILYWYRVDFATSNAKLPEKVVSFLRGEKKDALQRMLESNGGKSVTVKFLDYDWSTNASNFTPFDSATLAPDETGLLKLFYSQSS